MERVCFCRARASSCLLSGPDAGSHARVLHHFSVAPLAEGQLLRPPPRATASRRCFKQPHHGHHLLTFKYTKPHVHKAVHVGVRVFFFLHWRLVSTMAESEADTPSTPIEFESKYFEFDGVRLPPFCRGKMEEIANFSLRSSDIWIVTYPKSGKRATTPPCARVSLCLRISCCSLLQQFLQASLVIIKV